MAWDIGDGGRTSSENSGPPKTKAAAGSEEKITALEWN